MEIDGIKTNALLDTGAESLYTSSKLIDLLKKRPTEAVTKIIDMMLGLTTTSVEIYTTTLGAVNGTFDMKINLTKAHKSQLLRLDNPNYPTLLGKYSHLKGVNITMTTPDLRFLYVTIRQYVTIKTSTAQRVEKPGQPAAEKRLLGWTIMSPGRDRETIVETLEGVEHHTDRNPLCPSSNRSTSPANSAPLTTRVW